MNIFIQILLIVLFVTSCNLSQKKKEVSQIIDIKSIPEISFNELIDELTCIPLKKTTNTFIDCWKLIPYKEYLYLYSLSDFAVQIYNKEGIFIKRIDNRSKGKLETPTDILINTEKNELWICESRNKLLIYTLQGDFVKEIKLPQYCIKMVFIDNNYILVYKDLFDKKSDYLFELFNNKWESMNEFIEKGKMINTSHSYPQSLFAKDIKTNNIYAILASKSVIYKYINKKLVPFIYLDFKNNLLSEDKYPKNGFSDEGMSEIINKKQYIYSINNFHAISNNIIFKTEGKESMFYLINNNRRFKFKSLFDDLEPQHVINPIAGSDNEYLYIMQKKSSLIEHYRNKKCNYEHINKIISSKEELDGVIIRIKLKSI